MLRRVCDGLICVLVVMTLVGGPLQAQGNDEPQLCVGDYQSADEAKAQLARFVQTFSNLAEWQQRARTNREAILRGTGLLPLPRRCPLNPIVHSLRQYEGYTVENVAIESLPGVFVTGTDTGVGKTFASCVLVHALRDAGLVPWPMKPIAAGAIDSPQGPANEDTLALARSLLKMPSYTLDKVAKKLALREESGETLAFRHHRAIEDARVTGLILIELLQMAKKEKRFSFEDIQGLQTEIELNRLHGDSFTVFVQNKRGLKNLYRLVSMSHLEYLGKAPLIPKTRLSEHRTGLFLGTGSPSSELSKAYRMGKDRDELIEIARFYDFIEIMPADAYTDLEEGLNATILKEMYARFYEIGREIGLPALFTGNVHYLDPQDHKAWSVLKISDMAIRRRGQQFPPSLFDDVKLHYRTTEELLSCAEEMLGDAQKAQEVVIHNPAQLADQIEWIQPIVGFQIFQSLSLSW